MRFTLAELKFINLASRISDGVFDYENSNDEQFKATYGLTKKQSYKMAENLESKTFDEIERRKQKKLINSKK